MTRSPFRYTAALLAAFAFAACDDDETGPEEGHTPTGAALFVNGEDVSDNLVLLAGEPVRVEVRFLDENDEVITGIEDDHHAGLTFTPGTLATVESVEGENFQKDVTGQAEPGTGSVNVGYGHDEAADELSFGPFDVTVAGVGGAQ
jgi:hypothetical protein